VIRRAAALALSLALAGCMGQSGPPAYRGPPLRQTAQAGQVVAVELALARITREQGQWTAMGLYAAPAALLFTPQPVNAQTWLKGRANPATAPRRQLHQVWSSCDGSLAVARGGTVLADGSAGYFVTVWERQSDGSYKWVLDDGDTLPAALEEPDMVQASEPDCRAKAGMEPPRIAQASYLTHGAYAKDASLRWSVAIGPDNGRNLSVDVWSGEAFDSVIDLSIRPGF